MIALALRGGGIAQTPEALELAPFADRINDLMALVPSEAGMDSDAMLALTFADQERQLSAVGVPAPVGDELPEGHLAVTEGLPLRSTAYRLALDPEWWETFGFAPLEVARTLVVGAPGNAVTLFAGGIDPERVREALLAAGYEEVEVDTGGSYLSFGEGISPDTVVGRLGVGSMNQAVILDDTVVFTHREAMIQQVVQVIDGSAPSMLEQGGWADMVSTFSADVVGMMGVYPSILADLGDVSDIRQLAFAMREGADNRDLDAAGDVQPATAAADMPETRARVEVRIRYVDADLARREAEAIPRRWSTMASMFTGQPLTELMLVEKARVSDRDDTVATVDFRVQGPAGRWISILENRDLEAFVPTG